MGYCSGQEVLLESLVLWRRHAEKPLEDETNQILESLNVALSKTMPPCLLCKLVMGYAKFIQANEELVIFLDHQRLDPFDRVERNVLLDHQSQQAKWNKDAIGEQAWAANRIHLIGGVGSPF